MRWVITVVFAGIMLLALAKASGAEENKPAVLRAGDSVFVVVRTKSQIPFVSEPAIEISRVFETLGILPGVPSSDFLKKYPDYKKGYPTIPRAGKWQGSATLVADVVLEVLLGATKRTVTIRGPIRREPKPRILVGNVGPIFVDVNDTRMIVSVESLATSKRIALGLTLSRVVENDELVFQGIILEEGKGMLADKMLILPGLRIEKKENQSLLIRKSFDDAMGKLEKALVALKLPTK